jgi:hypothetical protein
MDRPQNVDSESILRKYVQVYKLSGDLKMTNSGLSSQVYPLNQSVEKAINSARKALGLTEYAPQTSNSTIPQFAQSGGNVEQRDTVYFKKTAEREARAAEMIEALATYVVALEARIADLESKASKGGAKK